MDLQVADRLAVVRPDDPGVDVVAVEPLRHLLGCEDLVVPVPGDIHLGASVDVRFYVDLHGYSQSMPNKSSNVKNEKQYEALKDKGMSKERAAKIANSSGSSSRGGKKSGSSSSSRSNSSQGGTTAQKKAAGRKGGKATANKS